MRNDFFVCKKDEIKSLVDRESKRHASSPRVYGVGYTLENAYWDVYDDGEDYYDCNLEHKFSDVRRYCVVYSDYSEKEIQEKFFDYLVTESYKPKDYEEISVGGHEGYYIDVYYNDDEFYSIYGLWFGGELSEEDIECLKDLAS